MDVLGGGMDREGVPPRRSASRLLFPDRSKPIVAETKEPRWPRRPPNCQPRRWARAWSSWPTSQGMGRVSKILRAPSPGQVDPRTTTSPSTHPINEVAADGSRHTAFVHGVDKVLPPSTATELHDAAAACRSRRRRTRGSSGRGHTQGLTTTPRGDEQRRPSSRRRRRPAAPAEPRPSWDRLDPPDRRQRTATRSQVPLGRPHRTGRPGAVGQPVSPVAAAGAGKRAFPVIWDDPTARNWRRNEHRAANGLPPQGFARCGRRPRDGPRRRRPRTRHRGRDPGRHQAWSVPAAVHGNVHAGISHAASPRSRSRSCARPPRHPPDVRPPTTRRDDVRHPGRRATASEKRQYAVSQWA